MEKEELQRKVEENTINFRNLQIQYKNYYDTSEKELHALKRDYFLVSEEKKNLTRQLSVVQQEIDFTKDDYAKKIKSSEYLERELSQLQDKYRDLSTKEAINSQAKSTLENLYKNKSDELEAMTKSFNKLKKSSGINELRKEYELKLKEVTERKDYYKAKVRILLIMIN